MSIHVYFDGPLISVEDGYGKALDSSDIVRNDDGTCTIRLTEIPEPDHCDREKCVAHLPSKIVQISSSGRIGDDNCGPHVILFALCADGSVWSQYHSSGKANVPTNGFWYRCHIPLDTPDRSE